jgi:hypothetical protein
MAEKKIVKKAKAPKAKTTKSKTTKAKGAKGKAKKSKEEPMGDGGIVIVDDDIEIDQEKINEERRAYLEEARSQEASD